MISALPMKFFPKSPPVRRVSAARDRARIARAVFLYSASWNASQNIQRDRFDLTAKLFALNQNTSISQPGTDIDERLIYNLLTGRIPVRAPQIILLAPIVKQRRLAIRVHLPAASQNATTNIHDDLDHRLIFFQHINHLRVCWFASKYV